MVVDNHVAVRRGIRGALAGSRYQLVAEAANGSVALRQAEIEQPDIVILDHDLPGISGLEVARRLKSARPALEVLVFSMQLSDAVIVQILKAGIGAYVSKAETLDQLIVALNALSVHRTHYSECVQTPMFKRVLAGKKLSKLGLLTDREVEVVQMIAEGWLMREIAGQLGVTKKTVETHRKNALDKINCRTTADIVRYAVRNNLIQP